MWPVTSHGRKPTLENEESDLVMVVAEKFWEETNSPQEQGANGEQTPCICRTISATGMRPTKTPTAQEMVIREAMDATKITTQSTQFKLRTV